MEKKHTENRLKALDKEFNEDSAQYNREQHDIVPAQAELDALQTEQSGMSFSAERQTEHSGMSFSTERQAELKRKVRVLHASLHEKRVQCNVLSARLPRCNFHYQLPEPGFDSRRVLGPICRLFEVRDPVNCTALATIAGERLFSVMVDDEKTRDLLLDHGQPEEMERTTFVTLNEVSGNRPVHCGTLHKAQEIGGGPENVQLAVNLVSCDSYLQPAMVWLFGDVLVCRDLDVGTLVSYHPQINCECVTREGAEFHTDGTVTGGPPVEEAAILIQLTELKQLEKDVKTLEALLSQNTAELQAMQLAEKRNTSLQQSCQCQTAVTQSMLTSL